MTFTPIDKLAAFRLESLAINADDNTRLVCRYTVGIVDDNNNYVPKAERSYVLPAAEADPLLNAAVDADGPGLLDQMQAAISEHLSLRPDWVA
ncbi:hypothetical protein [Pigmentiphaga sp. CHJ604]|uniref:hypothetical protein n=1 Tax=Pigmentiphaga sp. CHJ604 TaxID=3081984 RepID=UPI0030CB49CD